MIDWRWHDPTWRNRVDEDPERTAREALRHAVALREHLAEIGTRDSARAIFLVAVLSHLCALVDFDTTELWQRV